LRVRVALFLSVLFSALRGDFGYVVENSNFSVSQGSILPGENKRFLYNYDRLRFRGDYVKDGFFATFIGDGVNYYGSDYVESNAFEGLKSQKADTGFNLQTDYQEYSDGAAYVKLHRAYVGYEDDGNRVVAGVQNVSMGVGRIWTPTNLFNPKNPYAIEPDETFGIFGVSYVRHLSDISEAMAVV